MGNGLAIPHGTNEAKGAIRRTAISFVRYDEPVDWNGKPAEFVLGIAGAGNDHLALLAKIAETFTDKDRVAPAACGAVGRRGAGGAAGHQGLKADLREEPRTYPPRCAAPSVVVASR